MALTGTQMVATITALYAQAASTRSAIEGGWYFHESSRQAELGAVRMIEDTQIALLRDQYDAVLNGERSEQAWTDGAERAEQALRDIKGYSAKDTLKGILSDTAQATAVDVQEGATKVAEVTGTIAKEALSLTWTALPTVGKVAVVAVGIGAVVYFVARASDVVRTVKGTA